MTTEEWVRRLNKMAREMDDACDGVHPTAWSEITGKTLAAWKKLSKEAINEPKSKAIEAKAGK